MSGLEMETFVQKSDNCDSKSLDWLLSSINSEEDLTLAAEKFPDLLDVFLSSATSPNCTIRTNAISKAGEILSLLPRLSSSIKWASILQKDTFSRYIANLTKVMSSESDEWIEPWFVLLNCVHKSNIISPPLINSMLKLPEKLFKLAKHCPNYCHTAFYAWRKLILVLPKFTKLTYSKMVSILLAPLKVTFPHSADEAKLETWILIIEEAVKGGSLWDSLDIILKSFIEAVKTSRWKPTALSSALAVILMLVSKNHIASSHTALLSTALATVAPAAAWREVVADAWTNVIELLCQSPSEEQVTLILRLFTGPVDNIPSDITRHEMLLIVLEKGAFCFDCPLLSHLLSCLRDIFSPLVHLSQFREKVILPLVMYVKSQSKDISDSSLGVLLSYWLELVNLFEEYIKDKKDLNKFDVETLTILLTSPLFFPSLLWNDDFLIKRMEELANQVEWTNPQRQAVISTLEEVGRDSTLDIGHTLHFASVLIRLDKDMNMACFIAAASRRIVGTKPESTLHYLNILESTINNHPAELSCGTFRPSLSLLLKMAASFPHPYDLRIKDMASKLLLRLTALLNGLGQTPEEPSLRSPPAPSHVMTQSNFLHRLSKAEEKNTKRNVAASSLFGNHPTDERRSPSDKENEAAGVNNASATSNGREADTVEYEWGTARLASSVKVRSDFHRHEHSPRQVRSPNPRAAPSGITSISTTTNSPPARQPPSVDDLSSQDFVFIAPKEKKATPLTDHQKEKMRYRQSDIPALYQDLSQEVSSSQDVSSQDSVQFNGVKNTVIDLSEEAVGEDNAISFTTVGTEIKDLDCQELTFSNKITPEKSEANEELGKGEFKAMLGQTAERNYNRIDENEAIKETTRKNVIKTGKVEENRKDRTILIDNKKRVQQGNHMSEEENKNEETITEEVENNNQTFHQQKQKLGLKHKMRHNKIKKQNEGCGQQMKTPKVRKKGFDNVKEEHQDKHIEKKESDFECIESGEMEENQTTSMQRRFRRSSRKSNSIFRRSFNGDASSDSSTLIKRAKTKQKSLTVKEKPSKDGINLITKGDAFAKWSGAKKARSSDIKSDTLPSISNPEEDRIRVERDEFSTGDKLDKICDFSDYKVSRLIDQRLLEDARKKLDKLFDDDETAVGKHMPISDDNKPKPEVAKITGYRKKRNLILPTKNEELQLKNAVISQEGDQDGATQSNNSKTVKVKRSWKSIIVETGNDAQKEMSYEKDITPKNKKKLCVIDLKKEDISDVVSKSVSIRNSEVTKNKTTENSEGVIEPDKKELSSNKEEISSQINSSSTGDSDVCLNTGSGKKQTGAEEINSSENIKEVELESRIAYNENRKTAEVNKIMELNEQNVCQGENCFAEKDRVAIEETGMFMFVDDDLKMKNDDTRELTERTSKEEFKGEKEVAVRCGTNERTLLMVKSASHVSREESLLEESVHQAKMDEPLLAKDVPNKTDALQETPLSQCTASLEKPMSSPEKKNIVDNSSKKVRRRKTISPSRFNNISPKMLRKRFQRCSLSELEKQTKHKKLRMEEKLETAAEKVESQPEKANNLLEDTEKGEESDIEGKGERKRTCRSLDNWLIRRNMPSPPPQDENTEEFQSSFSLLISPSKNDIAESTQKSSISGLPLSTESLTNVIERNNAVESEEPTENGETKSEEVKEVLNTSVSTVLWKNSRRGRRVRRQTQMFRSAAKTLLSENPDNPSYSPKNWPTGDLEPWIAFCPSPGSSPASSILRQSLRTTESPSSTPSNKRVRFADPVVTKGLFYMKDQSEGQIQHPASTAADELKCAAEAAVPRRLEENQKNTFSEDRKIVQDENNDCSKLCEDQSQVKEIIKCEGPSESPIKPNTSLNVSQEYESIFVPISASTNSNVTLIPPDNRERTIQDEDSPGKTARTILTGNKSEPVVVEKLPLIEESGNGGWESMDDAPLQIEDANLQSPNNPSQNVEQILHPENDVPSQDEDTRNHTDTMVPILKNVRTLITEPPAIKEEIISPKRTKENSPNNFALKGAVTVIHANQESSTQHWCVDTQGNFEGSPNNSLATFAHLLIENGYEIDALPTAVITAAYDALYNVIKQRCFPI